MFGQVVGRVPGVEEGRGGPATKRVLAEVSSRLMWGRLKIER